MTPIEVGLAAIDDSLMLLPPKMDTHAARVMMVAICLQESRMIHRKQIKGPAVGLGQFEKGGGIKGVMTHAASNRLAREVCEVLGIEPTVDAVYRAMPHNDVLAMCFVRLLLWTDPRPLPVDDAQAAWDCYIRNWRPGKPHRQTWDAFFKTAQEVA